MCQEFPPEQQSARFYYKEFCRRYSEDWSASFRDFYEHLNIRTYSEAVCETIGSIMGIALANGRNLMPCNLNKEVFFRFNSPPYHVLVNKFAPKVTEGWRRVRDHQMYRKGPKRSGLKLNELSHSLEAFRRSEEANSNFPLDIFKV